MHIGYTVKNIIWNFHISKTMRSDLPNSAKANFVKSFWIFEKYLQILLNYFKGLLNNLYSVDKEIQWISEFISKWKLVDEKTC